ncbi:C1 family peptidase [Bdellovibrio sp. SKB1291214]|uniref:C1 family peptidase n=1 Tax=Bdellovibrio sp. SKB1291214 TaxID=1732569 RepID=UPI000B51B274|nr:C1 family peptidase [Bdellovibrio sp. SKB1291214]UYL09267.1 C1 family peptidase [Bdellovibrio sp. SKB1291214]
MTFVMRTLFFSAALLCSFLLNDVKAETKILSHIQTPVKDQQKRDTCAYFAISALVESTFKNLTGEDYDISEEFEIFRHKIANAWRPEVEFGNTYDILQSIKNDLYVYEEAYLPYQKESPDFTKPLNAQQTAFYDLRQQNVPKVQIRSLGFKQLTQMFVKRPWSEHVMTEIKANRPVVVTLNVAIPHINDQKGTFTMTPEIAAECASAKIPCGGHAILLMGYDSERKLFMFKNSWGPKWGNQGYGYVTFDHVDNYSDQFMTAYFDKLTLPSVKRVSQ